MNGSAEQCFSSAERAEVEAELLVMERIHKAVKIAAAAACGSQAAQMVLAIPKERVQRSKSISSGPDLYCHAPITLFRKLRVGLGAVQPLHLSLVSEFGVSRDLFYSDARDLAAAIIRCLDDVEGVRRDLADVRTREDGCSLLCSSLHMRRQRALGRLHCDACGTFCLGERGLRDHQHNMHVGHYEGALEAVAAAKGAIIPYTPTHGDGSLAELWAARAVAAERLKKALPPALEAARLGDLPAIRRLAGSGTWSPTGTVDRHGSSALHYAAGGGWLELCSFLVDELRVPVTQTQQKDGRTALHWAARNGHEAVCRWLIERGLDPDAGTRDGTRPLHWAIWQGHLGVCELLVAARADLHSRNAYGCNAIQWAAQSDTSDGLVACRWLQERGLDLGVLNCNGHSALHKAAVKGQKRVCAWLLSEEVGLGRAHLQGDADGNTPALMAKLEGFHELAAFLQDMAAEEAGRNQVHGAEKIL